MKKNLFFVLLAILMIAMGCKKEPEVVDNNNNSNNNNPIDTVKYKKCRFDRIYFSNMPYGSWSSLALQVKDAQNNILGSNSSIATMYLSQFPRSIGYINFPFNTTDIISDSLSVVISGDADLQGNRRTHIFKFRPIDFRPKHIVGQVNDTITPIFVKNGFNYKFEMSWTD